MDPALLKERKAFIDRAKAQPVVEKRKKGKDVSDEKPVKKQKSSSSFKPKSESSSSSYDYKSSSGSSQYKFAILAKIVKYMKSRHLKGDTHPLMIDEILDETNQLDVGSKIKHWLITEALNNNPKVKVTDNGQKYAFKPKFDIRDKNSLMKLLKYQDLHGLGGVMKEDVEESLPNAEKAFKTLGEHIITIVRPNDKKEILFYNDKYCRYKLDDDFQKLWRGVSIDGLDDKKIEEYLEKQGISSMQDVGLKKAVQIKRKKGGGKRKMFKKHNEHLEGVLEDYSETVK
ncbi:general transcription factor IIE subunit 2-like [Ostrea edulis]|uniref:general transcription factor IIE subunit 2-like n=1 Tax=Ostrea edulis TaxID=37623 RepID=UPI0020955AD0|nr:general transcription factor IIE subunit 2-like [Ostrea edulis]